MTRLSFDIAMKKGDIGEEIVKAHLESKGWVVYQPVTDGAHCFDILCIKQKKTAIAIDVKAKARMNKWPATGINQNHFEEYKAFSDKHNMPFWLIFVDEGQKTIYGNCLDTLEKPSVVEGKEYPFVMQTRSASVRLWPLASMIHIAQLGDADQEKLSSFSQRNYQYEVTA